MASITIRNLDDDMKRRLGIRAAEHGHSIEDEAREILATELAAVTVSGGEFYAAIRADVAAAGGGVRLEPFLRTPERDRPDFSGPEWGTYEDE
jgi:plasmid stability protein